MRAQRNDPQRSRLLSHGSGFHVKAVKIAYRMVFDGSTPQGIK